MTCELRQDKADCSDKLYTVNSSQLRLTGGFTRHMIMGCDELMVWRDDWHPEVHSLLSLANKMLSFLIIFNWRHQ